MAEKPTLDDLRGLSTLADLPPWQLEVVIDAVEPVDVRKGTVIIERASDDGFTYFLREGTFKLEAGDGQYKLLDVTPEIARIPVANLRPRLFSITAQTRLQGFRIPDIVLSAAGVDGRSHEASDISVLSEEEQQRKELESRLSFHLYRDLKADKAILPSLPDLALRIRQAIDNDISDAAVVARLVESDPAMAAKLLKAANSALYGGVSQIETTSNAIVRLGMQTTKQLVLSFALKEVFHSDVPMVRAKMAELWKHSAKVAALCFVLAREVEGLSAEEALLIGLVHDVGTIAILNYLPKYQELAADEHELELTIERLRGELGAMILRKWNFPPVIVAGARDAEYWLRTTDGAADYTDLIIVAQVHDLLRTDQAQALPPFEQISAVKRVLGDDTTPERSLQVMHDAKQQIDEMRSVLRA